MKQFQYTITDPQGIHARPAGLLVKAVKELDSKVTITKDGSKIVDATRLMGVMSLAIKAGDTVTVTVEGGSEEANTAAVEKFLQENL